MRKHPFIAAVNTALPRGRRAEYGDGRRRKRVCDFFKTKMKPPQHLAPDDVRSIAVGVYKLETSCRYTPLPANNGRCVDAMFRFDCLRSAASERLSTPCQQLPGPPWSMSSIQKVGTFREVNPILPTGNSPSSFKRQCSLSKNHEPSHTARSETIATCRRVSFFIWSPNP
ncbi:uncharacterized protein M421DRAFT_136920 [Didymella exigua CBS 183.55]|uniref:Uncharacterized protein n=1 Tax=Didymella exigua CBS 183.55 TaxID=1150837 RepID=A0A6A5RSN3_9PLEO|nr:uncharacterized protein M421DRAFT_136920 [Didymella exigua CBS 183.55]KAF1929346.1 hypothetical protein M421DRAFT_136920 [Didymella exigua CBS 183.55]